MKPPVLLLILGTIILSCTKATPVRSSAKAKEREELEKPGILADYHLWEVFGNWDTKPTREILTYHLAITLYSDRSFVKEKTEGDKKVFARGIFKDTMAFNRQSIILIYTNLPSNLSDPIFDKIIDGRELLLYGASTDTLVSAPINIDGLSWPANYYRYVKH